MCACEVWYDSAATTSFSTFFHLKLPIASLNVCPPAALNFVLHAKQTNRGLSFLPHTPTLPVRTIVNTSPHEGQHMNSPNATIISSPLLYLLESVSEDDTPLTHILTHLLRDRLLSYLGYMSVTLR